MGSTIRQFFVLASVSVILALWQGSVLALQRPAPRYSQQFMPETSFTCRNKIVGSYYADPETDCQVFHVCVSVAGSVQDYKFLCPNDTAFDQESQTCADWYDVDCEAATLYYASDNFDLYRIGSGLESVHFDQLRTDSEPQDHLQRSETSDPVRSAANTLNNNRVANNYQNTGNREVLRSSSSSSYYNRNNKEDDYESDKYKEDTTEASKKKNGVRKASRKQQFSENTGNTYVSSTAAPSAAPNNQNSYSGYYSGNAFNYQRSSNFASPTVTTTTTTVRPVAQENYNRNGQRHNSPSTTFRPPSSTNYQDSYGNYQTQSTTSRTGHYNSFGNNAAYTHNQQNSGNYGNYNSAGQFVHSTTLRPSSYQTNDYSNYQQRNYNNIQRGGGVQYTPSTTTNPTTSYDQYSNNNNNHNNNQYRSTARHETVSSTTAKYTPSYSSLSYAPTTYSPPTKKYVSTDNSQSQSAPKNSDNGQYYFDKSNQPIKSTTHHYYDSAKPSKKVTQYNNYDAGSSAVNNAGSSAGTGRYYSETSTGSYDLGRSSSGIGFSPSSINHLAETPRTTTPVPRRAASATTYNPNNFNKQRSSQSVTPSPAPRETTYVSGSARPFASTTRFPGSSTTRTKTGKKNDYDYAYYDNAGTLEYDGLDLEHVTGSKESTKIARN